jgi:hypothetical protein
LHLEHRSRAAATCAVHPVPGDRDHCTNFVLFPAPNSGDNLGTIQPEETQEMRESNHQFIVVEENGKEHAAVKIQPIIPTPTLINPSLTIMGLPSFRLVSGGALNVRGEGEKEFTIVASGAKVRRKA